MLTNRQKWESITNDFCSPQSYLDWGLRFIIAASLQRRVWYGPEHLKCFPNMYGILFGPPGIGKSLVIDLCRDILRTPKKKDVRINKTNSNNTEAEKFVMEKTEDENLKIAKSSMITSRATGMKDEPPLFMSAPDAITYESLVETIGSSLRRTTYSQSQEDGTNKLYIYSHCSTFFCLDELGSLFRKKSESVINLLLTLYGCPSLYEYKTKNSGEDRILNGCLSFLAGTTSDFMEEIARDKLIGKGFTARSIFVCANKKRKIVSAGIKMTPEQDQYKKDLVEHIKKLYPLYGQVQVSEETTKWIDNWWNDFENGKISHVNKSVKLDEYYPRKIIQVYKVAMSEHFLESTDMTIPLETFQRAIEILDKEELTMHLALTTDNGNPLSKITGKIYDYIVKNNGANIADLSVEFWDALPRGNKSLDEILPHLVACDKIKLEVKETGEKVFVAI
jgi:hypothetical protein